MVVHQCNKCNKQFNHHTSYQRHINRKNNCIIDEKIIEKNRKDCQFCGKIFKRTYDLHYHINNSCSVKFKNNIDSARVCELEQKMAEQQKIIELLIKMQQLNDNHSLNQLLNDSHLINQSLNTNSFNTQNITINVAAYGKENMSHITDDDYKKIFRLCNSCVPEFIKLKHFDKKHPENSNVYIPNMTGTHGYMYDGEQWNAIDKHKLIICLYDDNCDILIDKYNIMKEQHKNSNLGKFDKFIEKHDNDEVIKDTTRMIELIAYNCKETAKQHKKKSEKNM